MNSQTYFALRAPPPPGYLELCPWERVSGWISFLSMLIENQRCLLCVGRSLWSHSVLTTTFLGPVATQTAWLWGQRLGRQRQRQWSEHRRFWAFWEHTAGVWKRGLWAFTRRCRSSASARTPPPGMNAQESVTQPCPTLCDPMDCSPPGSSVHGILRQEYWRGLPCPPPGDFPDPGIKPRSPSSQQMLYHLSHSGSPGKRLALISRRSPNQPLPLPPCVFPESSAPAPRLDRPSSTAAPEGPASLPASFSFWRLSSLSFEQEDKPCPLPGSRGPKVPAATGLTPGALPLHSVRASSASRLRLLHPKLGVQRDRLWARGFKAGRKLCAPRMGLFWVTAQKE